MLRNFRIRPIFFLGAFSLIVAACATAVTGGTDPDSEPQTEAVLPQTGSADSESDPGAGNEATTNETSVPSSEANPFEGLNLRFNKNYWPDTDFSLHSVDYREILSGGPPPDGIPAIDNPVFESVEAADEWLGDEWPVMFFEWNADARAYPLAILVFHEIVNDEVGGRFVSLTFCPLCNATIAFDRTLPDGTVLDFGTTGNLRNSDLVMYDRQTKSWWQQFTGEAIVGELTGTQLEFLPSQIISWNDFKTRYPDGKVLSRQTGHSRTYGLNPYSGYDNINNNPFLFDGIPDGRLPAVERVVAVNVGGLDVAYPFSTLSAIRVANDVVADTPLVVFWKEGTVSIFSNTDQDTGSTGVFLRQLDGQILTFQAVDVGFMDDQTGSLWNLFGEAVEGPLSGQRLEQVVAAEHFWFAWAAFKPDTIVWSPS